MACCMAAIKISSAQSGFRMYRWIWMKPVLGHSVPAAKLDGLLVLRTGMVGLHR
jgi:hypothetical protein